METSNDEELFAELRKTAADAGGVVSDVEQEIKELEDERDELNCGRQIAVQKMQDEIADLETTVNALNHKVDGRISELNEEIAAKAKERAALQAGQQGYIQYSPAPPVVPAQPVPQAPPAVQVAPAAPPAQPSPAPPPQATQPQASTQVLMAAWDSDIPKEVFDRLCPPDNLSTFQPNNLTEAVEIWDHKGLVNKSHTVAEAQGNNNCRPLIDPQGDVNRVLVMQKLSWREQHVIRSPKRKS